jgi:dipeptidyl aminopeptidase/acylaminoacyl peptidase
VSANEPSALLMARSSVTPTVEPETHLEMPSQISVAELPVPVPQRTVPESVYFRRPRKIRRGQRIPSWFWIPWTIVAIGVATVLIVGIILTVILKALNKPAPEKPVVEKTSDYGTIQIEPTEPAPEIDLKVDGDPGHHWGEALRIRVGEHELEGSLKGNVVVREKFTVQAGDNPIHRVALMKPPPVLPPPPVETANLLVDCNRGRATDIFLMNADGGDPVNLTGKGLYPSAYPAWSPDGKQIVFSSGAGNFCHLYVMTMDNREVKQLTTGARLDLAPSWSIDGKIAFSSTSAQVPQSAIYVLNADGSSPLVNLSPKNAADINPAWSPDGKKIAFLSYRAATNQCRLCIMDADGKNRQEIYAVDIPNGQIPAWSPDGRKIAYVESDGKGAVEVFVIDGDGSNRTQLGRAGGVNRNPAWKPDGKQLAFVHNASSLYLINSDGSGQKEILKDQVQLGRLAWKPCK